MNIYKVQFYTMSDGKDYQHVTADTSAEAIKKVESTNSDFHSLLDVTLEDENYLIRTYGLTYVNRVKGVK